MRLGFVERSSYAAVGWTLAIWAGTVLGSVVKLTDWLKALGSWWLLA